KDASDRITILHQQHSLSSSAKRKRELSRPLNHCPLNQGFHGSNCAPNVNPQAHRIDCMIGNAYTGYLAYCGPNEICVDGLRSPNVFHLAFCVSTENFVIFAKDQLRQATTSAATQAGFHSQAGTKYAVEAVMTSPDSHTTVVASNLDIEAQTSETVNNARSWRTLNGGTAQCNNCGSVEIATVPALTQRIAIRVKVQDSTLSGLLYLTQIVE
ncbi:MAG: hypothetical protein M1830_005519, partial [Pleopsidium flavum]